MGPLRLLSLAVLLAAGPARAQAEGAPERASPPPPESRSTPPASGPTAAASAAPAPPAAPAEAPLPRDRGDGADVALPPVDVPLPVEAGDALPAHASPSTRDPSAAVTTVDVASKKGEAKDAAALLASVPGAVLSDAGGAGQRKSLSLRGAAGNAVLVLLDGVPLSGPGAAMDLSRLPTAALERIEVLRGAASARYGPGAMGGVVNLVSRAPGGTRAFGDFTQGSFLTTLATVGGATRLLGGDGLLLLHGLHSRGDFSFQYDERPALDGNPLTTATRENNQALQGGGLARYRASLGATTVDVLFEGTAERRGLAGTVQNPTPGAQQSTLRGTLSARSFTAFESGGSLSVLGYGRLDDGTFTGAAFGAGRYHQLESSAGAEAVFSRLFFSRHGLTALVTGGGDWLSEPSGANPSQGRFGAMLADEVLFFDGALGLNASVRVDVAGAFTVFSPKAGAVVQLPKGFEVKANVGQASRPPGFQERYVLQGTLMPNPALRPERALSADVTAGWHHEKAAVAVTGFGALYEDLITYEYYPPALAKPFNVMAARVAGVEVEGRYAPAPWLDTSVAYTFLSTQNLRDDPRYYLKALPYRPAHRLHARVAGGVALLRAHAEVLFQSRQYVNRTETLALSPRTFVNVGVSSTPWKRPEVTVAFEVKNLFDTQSQDLDGYPLPPRAAFFTLALAWEGVTQ
ncbi:MAG: TonB-dependent receptor [Myxococcales bacterium]|nr:TonB-dependent receptor [Myxococcales bacterium]